MFKVFFYLIIRSTSTTRIHQFLGSEMIRQLVVNSCSPCAAVPNLPRSESISSHPVELGSRAGSEDSQSSAARSPLLASPVTAEPLAAAPSYPSPVHSHPEAQALNADEEPIRHSGNSEVHTPSPDSCEEAEEGGNNHRRRGSTTPQRKRERFFPAERPLPGPQTAAAEQAQPADPPEGRPEESPEGSGSRVGFPEARSTYDPTRYQRGEGVESSPGEVWTSPEPSPTAAAAPLREAPGGRALPRDAKEPAEAPDESQGFQERAVIRGIRSPVLRRPPSLPAAVPVTDGGRLVSDAGRPEPSVAVSEVGSGRGSVERMAALVREDAEGESPAGVAVGEIRVDVKPSEAAAGLRGEVEQGDGRRCSGDRESSHGTALKDWGAARRAASLSPPGDAHSILGLELGRKRKPCLQ